MSMFLDRGFIAYWRAAGQEDMALDPHTFKLWIQLLISAQHTRWKTLEPGELLTSADYLLERLREYNRNGEPGKTYSKSTLFKCLNELQARGYITYESKPGYGLRIRIIDWAKMQGKKPKGYNYHRADYPTPAPDEYGITAD